MHTPPTIAVNARKACPTLLRTGGDGARRTVLQLVALRLQDLPRARAVRHPADGDQPGACAGGGRGGERPRVVSLPAERPGKRPPPHAVGGPGSAA
jgi:hypothetical protein